MDPNAAPAALRAPAPAQPQAWLPAPGRPVPPASEPLVRRLLVPLGTLAAVAAAFAYVGAVDPNHPGHYPVCPLYAVTGIYCPGCGGLRSAHAVAHGDFAAALGDNALAVVGYGVFAVVMVVWLIRAVQGRSERFTIPPALWWGIGSVALVFSVLRNLPMGSFLAP
ncbi:DUF2752 domain-containing protein [Streptomyces sp. NBC_01180]|uniref:DUF2752 domain-containing protein n=1 Tax=Streptomyces sp. NBC_01180 TaxID=2903763 RepID=UPI0038653A12